MEMADEKRLMSDGDRCANSQKSLARTLVCGFWWINIGSLYLSIKQIIMVLRLGTKKGSQECTINTSPWMSSKGKSDVER